MSRSTFMTDYTWSRINQINKISNENRYNLQKNKK